MSSSTVAVSHGRILRIAIPMMMSHVTTPLLGVVDATVIGRLGEAHLLGAVALGAIVFDVIFWSFGALRMSTAGLTAQAVGAGDRGEMDRVLARALALAFLVGILLVIWQQPIGALAARLAGASPAVTTAMGTYFTVRILSAPFALANYVVLGAVLGRGRSDLGFAVQVSLNLANIALSVLFVMGFGLGIAGAALGTTLAEIVGLGVGLAVLWRLGLLPRGVGRRDLFDVAALRRLLSVNVDIMIRTAALSAAYAVFSSFGARAGDVTLAANAVLLNVFLVAGYGLDGFATAAEALCGQALGARDEATFRRTVRLALVWSLGFGLAASVALFAAGGIVIDAISTDMAVRREAREHLALAALSPLVGAPSFAFDGIYIGATWTRPMRDLMLAAVAAFLAVSYLPLGNTGLWAAFLTLLAARGAGQALAYPVLARRAFR